MRAPNEQCRRGHVRTLRCAVLLVTSLGCVSASKLTVPDASAPQVAPAIPISRLESPPLRPPLTKDDLLDPAAILREPSAIAVRDAVRMRQRGAHAEAQVALRTVASTAAALERARLLMKAGDLATAAVELDGAATDPALGSVVQLERGRLAMAAKRDHEALALLLPLLDVDTVIARVAAPLVAEVLAREDPAQLVQRQERVLALTKGADLETRSLVLGFAADALAISGDSKAALALRKERYLTLPEALATPLDPPAGVAVTASEALARAERLLEAHRNDRALSALAAIPPEALDEEERCRRQFSLGLGERKERRYEKAEEQLDRAVEVCSDPDVLRRARYLRVKVISIRDGLRAIAEIDDFVARYGSHSMADDVLFWGGDLYQRRGRDREAERYYRQAAKTTPPGDHCGEARWRIAWMAYRRGELDTAAKDLSLNLSDKACVADPVDRARAAYWLGRVQTDRKKPGEAIAAYEQASTLAPPDYYGQAARWRLADLGESVRARIERPVTDDAAPIALCVGHLAHDPSVARGLDFLVRGLIDDAAMELREVARHRAAESSPATCAPEKSSLLLALLLDQAGAHREAHWQLRTDFAVALERLPDAQTLPVWRAAYPLAFRSIIEEAERGARLSPLLLQALVREESALDPMAVSWAGAYGLTQLLPSVAREAASMLKPSPRVTRGEDLLDPVLSARLGGTFLGYLIRRYDGSEPLAIAGYNAGDPAALKWWHRHQGEPLDVLAEELTIKETRAYLKRVLRTYGIYRWLYADGDLSLPVGQVLPPRAEPT